MALVALAHNELEWLKNFSQKSLLVYEGLIELSWLLTSSRNCWPFWSKAWNVIFQIQIMLLHSFILLKFYNDLQGSRGVWQNCFVSLLIDLKRSQLQQLGYSQNSIELSLFVMKNFLSSLEIAIKYTWEKWTEESKMSLAIWIELVIIMIFDISRRLVAWLMLHLIAKNLASVDVMLTTW